jgi:RNA polymerase sigma factor (TIGR02999 family)
MQITKEEVTELLVRWSDGDPRALEFLMPLVVDELRLLARGFFKGERGDHTLQPTALVNEVYMKLEGQRRVRWQNRAQFFKFASTLMRRVLVDYARTKSTAKRGHGTVSVPLDQVFVASENADPDLVLAIDSCLGRLAELNPRQVRIVEMRYFIGLTMEEIAETEGVALATVKREWRSARLWLLHELRTLGEGGDHDEGCSE